MKLAWKLRGNTRGPSALAGATILAALGAATSSFAADAVVRPYQQHQRMTGFGASSAWTAQSMSDADADLLFTTDPGVGFTLLRVRIPPTGCNPPKESCEVVTAQKAQMRGASVWSTPWSPAPQWKSNGTTNNGGTLLPADADDWAQALVSYVQYMANQGVTISYLSAQNEPTQTVNYESCIYSPTSLADFVGNHLGPAFASSGLSTKLMAPETVGWTELPNFALGLANTATAMSALSVVATHSYDGTPESSATITQMQQEGKELWETEAADPQKSPFDPGIGSGIRVAQMMHAAIVRGGASAWHYWWIFSQSEDNQGLIDRMTDQPYTRLFAMGNFARYVRPGFYNVQMTDGPQDGVNTSGYFDPASGQVVIVAINSNAAAVTQSFVFDSVTVGSLNAWVTSADSNLASAGSVDTTGGFPPANAGDDGADPSAADAGGPPSSFQFTLAAQSITTFVGSVLGPGPVVAPDQSTTTPAKMINSGTTRRAASCSLVAHAGGGDFSEAFVAAIAAALGIVVARRKLGARTREHARR